MHHLQFHKILGFSSKLLHSEMGEIYLTNTILTFAGGLMGVFVPIYLVDLGFTLPQVILYFMLYSLFIALFAPIALAISSRIGMKHMILAHAPLHILYLLGLIALPTRPWLFFWIPVLSGIQTIFYWMPFNILFAEVSQKGKRGTQVGILSSLGQAAGLVAPLLGGIVIVSLGYPYLFGAAMVLIMISAGPLLLSREVFPVPDLSLKRMFTISRFSMAFIAEGVHGGVRGVVWPLFIYFTLASVVSVGLVSTITGIGVIVFTIYIGHIADLVDKKRLLHVGAVLLAITWFVRPLATTGPKIYTIGLVEGFAGVVLLIPFAALIFDTAANRVPEEFLLSREIWLGVGRVLGLALLLLFSKTYTAGFMMAGAASLVFVFF